MTTLTTNRRRLLRLGVAGVVTAVVMAVALTIASVSGIAWAANDGSAATSYWHIGYVNPSNMAFSFAAAPAASDGIASLNLTKQDNTSLLVTENKGKFPGLLGDLAGKSVSATFTVSGLNSNQNFTYYGEGTSWNPCGTPASVRYFFETSNGGGSAYTHYWWSNPVGATLSANGPRTLSNVSFNGANWSDLNGQSGTTEATGFNAAVSNVTMIGLSFGGGCFFENGVGTTDGSGTFTLNTFTVN